MGNILNAERLAEGIKELLIDDAIESYKEMYVLKDLPNAPSLYEKDIHTVLATLSEEGRESFYRLLVNVITDSATSFCAFLDGSCGYLGQDSNLLLYSEEENEELLNGSLMSYLDKARGIW